jgi:hypothetical protein
MINVEDLEDMEKLTDQINQMKEKVDNSPSWRELISDAEYEGVVNMLLVELKELLAAHVKEYKVLLKENEISKCEELKCLISLVKLREKEIEALAPKVR